MLMALFERLPKLAKQALAALVLLLILAVVCGVTYFAATLPLLDVTVFGLPLVGVLFLVLIAGLIWSTAGDLVAE
jgi:hypothetical protein